MPERGDRPPGVGVGVVVTREGSGRREVLLVRRRHPGAGSWSTPGGYLDRGESFEACATREVAEEVGLEIDAVRFVAVSNDCHDDGKHNVTVWMAARPGGGEARVAAPEELSDVGWFPLDALPEPLYRATANLVAGDTYPPDQQRLAFGDG